MRLVSVLGLTISLLGICRAQTPLTPALMPMPAEMEVGSGQLVIGSAFSVKIGGPSDPRLRQSIEIFLNRLQRQTGIPALATQIVNSGFATLTVHCARRSKSVPELGEDESYSLEVTSSGATLNASTTLGAMRGLQTLLQLVQTGPQGFTIPAISIQDRPRFQWRGLMIDVARHFEPMEVLKRNLDGMAAVKLNVFHWHLSDDQGFRVESRKLPKLQEMGSDGFYYTQEQVREIIAYAADRGIRVVPEFDMPAHSTAWLVGYPKLASGPGPFEIARTWGVLSPAMDPTREQTYKFLNKFIGEMAKLFPDRYFHIGGDEVNGKFWDDNPRIQKFKRAHHLESNEQLQKYFTRRVQKIVTRHGKIMIGWDEIMQPDLPKDIVVQSWRGQASLAQAAQQGYRGLLSYGYYLDLMWPAARHYAVDPLGGAAAELEPDEKARILGGEACMWSEYVSPETIDSRIWPRMAAVAERLWSPQNVTDVNSMYTRLDATSDWLEWVGLKHQSYYRLMLRRIAGGAQIADLKALADVVEPVKDYTREELASVPATSLMPLNRLVDAAHPESMEARAFANLVEAFIVDKSQKAVETQIRIRLERWRDSQDRLQKLTGTSELLQETIPLSLNLYALAAAGLEALEYIDHAQSAPQEWTDQEIAFANAAAKPKAQLLLVVAPAIGRLIQASGIQTATVPAGMDAH